MPKEQVTKMLWGVDIKDTIEHDDVCSSEVKSNISEEISSSFIPIILHLAKWSTQRSQKGVSFYVSLSIYSPHKRWGEGDFRKVILSSFKV